MDHLKSLVKIHILTICAIISIISMAMPFVIVKAEADIAGYAGNSTSTTSGFSSISRSIFALLLIVGPILIIAMNYIKPLEKYKAILAIMVPIVCIISLIIVFFQVKSATVSASGGGYAMEVSASLGVGAIFALFSYLATIVAGAVTYYNFTLDKKGFEKLKKESFGFAKNVQSKVSGTVKKGEENISSDSEENITTLNTLESGQRSMETKEKKNY